MAEVSSGLSTLLMATLEGRLSCEGGHLSGSVYSYLEHSNVIAASFVVALQQAALYRIKYRVVLHTACA